MRTSVWTEKSKLTSRYSVRYFDPVTGLKTRALCETYAEAQRLKASLTLKLQNHRAGKGDPEAIPLVVFEEYLTALQRLSRRPDTLAMKRKNLTPFLNTVFKMSQITHNRIQTFIEEMHAKGFKVDTIAIKLRDLRAFLNWSVKEKKLVESPFTGIQVPASTFIGRKLTFEEVMGIYANLTGVFKSYFVLALETGARQGETLKARWSDIDLTTGAWAIPAANCKTKIARTIPLSPKALTALSDLSRRGDHVFQGWTKSMVQNQWDNAKRAAGIKGRLRIHDLRHTFASNWQGRAGSLREICGWKSDFMLHKYTHVELKHLAEEVNKTSSGIWGQFGDNTHVSTQKRAGSTKRPNERIL